ncbi:hypothetical protein PG997_007254 [Apiospora hydei]|uniref:Heterokaryon incompatibility domain-containing protein n=1 Tax=Apiospora hydei TaxID=1337664 RepID=A0ABR1W7I2_9PEZI
MLYGNNLKERAIHLIEAPEGSCVEMSGRCLDKDWVDLGLLQKWNTECLQKHGQTCFNPLKIPQVYPAWLIDTYNDCLVPGDGIPDFVTLSYVWGAGKSLCTERANVEDLQQHGALTKSPISPVILHAMGLIRALEERYLWADALCIVQNGGEQTAQQLLLMAKIYASAKFTIVVTDGDASTGIPGIKGISRCASPTRWFCHSLRTENWGLKKGGTLTFGRPPYHTRAWTYQEHSISQRLLVFEKGQFYWICSSAAFRESSVSHCPALHQSHRFRSPNILSGYPDLQELRSMIFGYNGRDHSFPEDALAGVTGMLEVFSRSFEGGFLYGPPVMFFHAALMWRSSDKQKARRRLHSGKDHCILQGSHLPSWSWLGWKDSTVCFDENNGTLYDSFPATIGITQWHSHVSPDTSEKRLIGPCFPSTLRNDIRDYSLESQMARGWKADAYDPNVDGPFKPAYGNTVYRHSSLPNKKFWYWFPIKDLKNDSGPATTPQHAFISCKTRRGWFRTQGFYPGELQAVDANGYCGRIHVPKAEYDAYLPPGGSYKYLTIELVAICLRKNNPCGTPGYSDTDTTSASSSSSSTGTQPSTGYGSSNYEEESYGVLWVKWMDGVAYRKGVGEIYKKAWESHDLEDVDIILG